MQYIQDNLAGFSFFISLLALVATWFNFWNSRKSFLASNYPKLKGELYFLNHYKLPIFNICNESDKITANDISIEINIINCFDFKVFKCKWFLYSYEKLARLKPLESFVKSDLSLDDFQLWLKDRGYEPSPPYSVEKQSIMSCISLEKSYSIRLTVSYISNVFGANRVCKIKKVFKLISCLNSEAIEPKEKFYWKLSCKRFMFF
ncbi:MAG: hypothetical protein HWQ41_12850 [Nostoc sp. NOS(2021)]|uniref:hypothetical protein n=1 Tax=Nostoc sp. NOS(2021) TaxID=2815407 RepID=UPI0025CDFA7F|nr:hypothetical protein [Nostoc sp. NOS(2021)]MBN3896111.1 hypothetical protein [Nostoc sp. NOS(2021)]